MSLDPYKQRELVFLLLYSFDMGQDILSSDIVELVKDECKVAKKYVVEARGRVETILKVREACDTLIAKVCTDYKIERIQSVERNIIRLAIFELILEQELPPKVVFAEAKRLAKKFSTEESSNFVHALLAAASTLSGMSVEGEAPDLKEAYQVLSEAIEKS